MNDLRSAIDANKKSAPWPSTLETSALFLESMDTTFDFEGDDFPTQGLIIKTLRKKLIHSVGAVVETRYVSLNSTYSGLYGSGCSNALLRFSIAVQAKTTGEEDAFTPGIAIKFLRSGVPSANIFAMYSLMGQPGFNFFKHDLSSHVPELSTNAPNTLQLLRIKFQTGSTYAAFVGSSSLAEYDENGRAFPRPIFPFRLHFHPNTTLHNALPDNYTGVDFEDQIVSLIKPGQHIYDVYAQETPIRDDLTLIGKVYAKAAPTRSFFADKSLFMQHTRFEADLAHYPQWEGYAKSILVNQRQVKAPGYHYPDLPWK